MAQAGLTLRTLADEFDVTTYHTVWNLSGTQQAVDVSTHGQEDKTYLAGQRDGSYSLSGVWNDDAQADLKHASDLGQRIVYSVFPQGQTAGASAWLVHGLENSYNIPASTSDAVRHNLGGVSTNTFGGQVAYPLGSVSAGNQASVDGGAQTLFGGHAHLHVTSFTGTNIVVTLEDSANDSTFATLASFTSATGVGAERISFAGTVERYVRLAVSGTFSAATIAVVYARDVR